MSRDDQTLFDALRACVHYLGGFKSVAAQLWPTRSSGDSFLRDALNPERCEKLDPEELVYLLRLARDAGCHCAMEYFAQAAGYERPIPRPPGERAKDELIAKQGELIAQLQSQMRAFEATVDRTRSLTSHGALDRPANLKSVK